MTPGTVKDLTKLLLVLGVLGALAAGLGQWSDLKHVGADAKRKAEEVEARQKEAEAKHSAVEKDVQAIRLQQATQGSDLRHVLDEQKVQRSLLERVAEKVGAK